MKSVRVPLIVPDTGGTFKLKSARTVTDAELKRLMAPRHELAAVDKSSIPVVVVDIAAEIVAAVAAATNQTPQVVVQKAIYVAHAAITREIVEARHRKTLEECELLRAEVSPPVPPSNGHLPHGVPATDTAVTLHADALALVGPAPSLPESAADAQTQEEPQPPESPQEAQSPQEEDGARDRRRRRRSDDSAPRFNNRAEVFLAAMHMLPHDSHNWLRDAEVRAQNILREMKGLEPLGVHRRRSQAPEPMPLYKQKPSYWDSFTAWLETQSLPPFVRQPVKTDFATAPKWVHIMCRLSQRPLSRVVLDPVPPRC